MARPSDVIVIGASLDGLAAAAAMARAGRSVLVVDPAAEVGGVAAKVKVGEQLTAPLFPSRFLMVDGQVADQTGIATLHHERSEETLLLDSERGQFRVSSRLEHLQAELQRGSEADARRLTAFLRQFGRLAEVFSWLRTVTPPDLSEPTRQDWWNVVPLAWKFRGLRPDDIHELLRAIPLSARDFTQDWFETPWMQTALCFRAVEYSPLGPRGAGGGLRLLHAFAEGLLAPAMGRRVQWMSASEWVQALQRVLLDRGAVIRRAAVQEILVEGNRAVGVRLEGGECIESAQVLSSREASQTCLELIDPMLSPPALHRDLKAYRSAGTASRILYAVDRLPEFLAGTSPGTSALLVDEMDDLERASDAIKYGRLAAAPPVEIGLADPGRPPAAAGPVVLAASVHGTPLHLREGDWNEQRAEMAARVRRIIGARDSRFEGSIQHEVVYSPADLAAETGTPGGHLQGGDLMLDQYFMMRPTPDLARYRGPVEGLYLCGPGTHPGGAQTGHSGCNAAREMLKDRR